MAQLRYEDRPTPDVLVPASSLDNVLQHAKCPVCKEHMVLPITLCIKGHSICFNCRQANENCTICLEPFCETRNVNLEHITLWSSYPCSNEGCPTTLPLEFMPDHINTCPYSQIVCPLYKLEDKTCNWEGILMEFQSHVEDSHNALYFEGDVFKSTMLTDTINFFSYEGELFLFLKKFFDNRLFCTLQKFDLTSSNFIVDFKLTSRNSLEKMSVSYTVKNTFEDTDVLFKKGVNCLRLHEKLYNRFVVNNKLALDIIISKAK